MSKRKWSFMRAGLYGLIVQFVAIALADWYWGSDEWGRITFYLESGVSQAMAIAILALLPGPSAFIIGAWLRNALIERAANAGRENTSIED